MKEVATALLRLDSGLVLQRRRDDHYRNPGMQGLFGGHVEPEDNFNPEASIRFALTRMEEFNGSRSY